MSRARIYELDTASTSIGKYGVIDSTDNSSAENVLWPHHIVSAFPTSPVAGLIYFLSATVGYAPAGLYMYDGTGWTCLYQYAEIALADWDGTDIATVVYSGVEYTVSVTAANDQLNNLTLSTFGIVQIVISNTTPYTITDPTSGYKTGDSGLDSLSAASVHLTIMLTGTDYEYAATERVAL